MIVIFTRFFNNSGKKSVGPAGMISREARSTEGGLGRRSPRGGSGGRSPRTREVFDFFKKFNEKCTILDRNFASLLVYAKNQLSLEVFDKIFQFPKYKINEKLIFKFILIDL